MTPNTRTVLLTSFASSLIMGLALVFIVWGVNLNKGIDAPGNLSIAFGVGLIIGFSAGIGAWVHRLVPKVKVSETVTEQPVEQPTPERFSIMQDADTPYPCGSFGLPEGITKDHLREFARQVLILKREISHGDLSGKGKPFTRTEYEAMRAYFLLHKWVRWNSDGHRQQGLSIRKKGLDAFTQLLNPLPIRPAFVPVQGLQREDTHAHTRIEGDEWSG